MTLDLLQSISRKRLFEQDRLLLRAGPFAAVYAAALCLYPFGSPATYGAWFAGAILLAAAMLAAIALVPWQRFRPAAQVLPLLAFLASVALLREAHGGAASGYAPMAIVAVVWAGVFAGRTLLALVIAAVGLVIGLPPLVSGAPAYPSGEFRRAVLFVVVSALCGVVIQLLVRAVLVAEDNLTRLRADEVHDDLVQAFAAAQLALATGDTAAAGRLMGGGLTAAQALVAEMLGDVLPGEPRPGMLRRGGTTLSE